VELPPDLGEVEKAIFKNIGQNGYS